MALRYPLVLNDDNTIQELPVGDTVLVFPSSLPITLHDDSLIQVPIVNGEHIPVLLQTGVVVNVPVRV